MSRIKPAAKNGVVRAELTARAMSHRGTRLGLNSGAMLFLRCFFSVSRDRAVVGGRAASGASEATRSAPARLDPPDKVWPSPCPPGATPQYWADGSIKAASGQRGCSRPRHRAANEGELPDPTKKSRPLKANETALLSLLNRERGEAVGS
jgi:hypothetical protein